MYAAPSEEWVPSFAVTQVTSLPEDICEVSRYSKDLETGAR